MAKPNIIRRLYDWVLKWSEHPQAIIVLFVLAFAEAIIFPIPVDILLLTMAMGTPHKAIRFALICTAGSVLGALAGYYLGWGLWGYLDDLFYRYIPGFSEQLFNVMATKFSENAFLATFTGGFTPIPFKVFTIAAGASAIPIVTFFFGALVSRGLRYCALALLIKWSGPTIKEWIDRYFNILTIVVTVILVGGFYLLQL